MTLNETLALSKKLGFDPKAIKFLEEKIEANGPDDEVVDEGGLIVILSRLSGFTA